MAEALCGDHVCPPTAEWAGEHQPTSVHLSVRPPTCVCLGAAVCDVSRRTPQGERGHHSRCPQPFLTAPWN